MVSWGRVLAIAASLVACILIASAVAWAASSPGVDWEKTYDVQGNDQGWGMQETLDGGYVVVGTSGNLVCLAKMGSDGSLQWKNTYGFGEGSKGYGVAQATDGGYVVTGSVRQGGKDKVLLMKVSQNGTQVWNKTYGDSNAGSIEGAGTSVRQISGGYVIAAQYPYPTTGNVGLYLIMADTNGNMVRNVMIGKGGDITSPTVERASDGGFIVAATLYTKGYMNIQPDYDIYLVKFSPSGATQWEKAIGGAGSQYAGKDGCVRQAGGGYVIAGENGGAYLAKVDSSGNLLWGKQYNDTARASSVATTEDGGYVLTATDSAGKPIIIKASSNGNEEWRQTVGDSGEVASVQEMDDGSYVAAGSSGGDLYLVKLKAPAKASSSLFLNDGGLFSGMDMFRPGPFGDSSTDLGQTITPGNGMFGPSSLKMFSLIWETQTAPASSLFKHSSLPAFDIETPSAGSWSFPKISSPFGDSGWPFS